MSFFKTHLIILKIEQKEKTTLLSVFSREYGKMILRQRPGKKQKNLDLGYVVNGEILTKSQESIHSFGNTHILSTFPYLDVPPEIIHEYLKLLALIYSQCFHEHPIPVVYDMIAFINQHPPKHQDKLLFLELFFLSTLGLLEIDPSSSERIKKILMYISHHSFESCLRLSGLHDEERIFFQSLVDGYLKKRRE